MSKDKRAFKDTAFGKFLNKAKEAVPELASVGLKLVTGNIGGAVEEVGSILKKKSETDATAKILLQEFELNKMQYSKDIYALDIKAFEAEVKDKKSARKLYGKDSLIQKIFAIVFLLGYGLLTWYLLQVLMNTVEIPKLAETMITMIWTGTSTKLNTIVDFFFGGSVDKTEK